MTTTANTTARQAGLADEQIHQLWLSTPNGENLREDVIIFARALLASNAATVQEMMKRLAQLLDDDKFGEMEAIVASAGIQPPEVSILAAHSADARNEDADLSDGAIREIVNQLRDIAINFHDTQQLRVRIASVIVPRLKDARNMVEGAAQSQAWRELRAALNVLAIGKMSDASRRKLAAETLKDFDSLAAPAAPAPTEANPWLSVEQREAIAEVVCLARTEGLPGTAETLLSILSDIAPAPAAQADYRELDLYDEIECDLPALFGRASTEGHEAGQALAAQLQAKMRKARQQSATPAVPDLNVKGIHEPTAGMVLDAGEVQFLATRLRRLFKHFNYPLPAFADDSHKLIGIAPSCIGAVLANLNAPADVASEADKRGELEPVHGDVLPPIGSRVFIHLASVDAWRECTVVGYYVWPSFTSQSEYRVNVRVRMDDGTLNARMLCDIQRERQQGADRG